MLKVIIVDDEPNIRQGLTTIINWKEQGFIISGQAEDGIEALALYEKERPQLVITDIKMPRLNGLELAGELKQRNPELTINILSGYNDFSYAKAAIKYGVSNYLLKPVDPEELCAELHSIKQKLTINQSSIKEPESERSGRCDQGIKEILNYIQDHYHEDLNIKSLSSMFHINHVYLGQLFKKETGEYFHDHINKIRIENAKRLLTESRFSISEIAIKVGYKYIDHFYRNFKNIMGYKPGEYRKNVIKDSKSTQGQQR